jgi:hypothetical protein
VNEPAAVLEPYAVETVPGPAEASVAGACAESGWPFTERASVCLVRLEVNREAAPFHARLRRAADGGIRAWVDLTAAARELGEGGGAALAEEASPESPACRAAVDAMLADVSTRMRLVRGVCNDGPAGRTAGFEVSIPAPGGGEQVAEALSALSVACQLAGPETQLLMSDPVIAGLYLNRFEPCPGTFPAPAGNPGHSRARLDPSSESI